MSIRTSVNSVSSSYILSVCPTPPAAQPHRGLQFPLDLCNHRWDQSEPSSWFFSYTEEAQEFGSDFVSVFPWACARTAICRFPSAARLSPLTSMHNVVTLCSFLVSLRMSAIWQAPLTFTVLSAEGDGFRCHQPHKHTHCAWLAVRLASPSYSIAHPFCTSQPGCIISLIYYHNSFLFQNNLALLATTSLISLAELHNFFSELHPAALFQYHSSGDVLSQAPTGVRMASIHGASGSQGLDRWERGGGGV